MNSCRFLNIAALAAVFLAASPPAFATVNNTGLPPDDPIVQKTEQFDGSMNMVAVQGDRTDRLVIPIVAVSDYNAQTLIFDDHPRAARSYVLDNPASTWTSKMNVDKVIAQSGLYLGNSHYYLNANGANATSFNPTVNCSQDNGPAELSASIKVPQPVNTAWAWRPSWR